MDKYFDANRPCQAVSKQFIKHYKPEKPTLLIAINDFNDQFKPFKERVNYLTYSNYVDVCWLYFDDIGYVPFGDKSPNMFTKKQAKELIQFLDKHFETKDFDRVLVHCYAGVSRSQAVALFIARYYLKDQDLFEGLYHQEGKVTGGNHFVYTLLEETYDTPRFIKDDTLIDPTDFFDVTIDHPKAFKDFPRNAQQRICESIYTDQGFANNSNYAFKSAIPVTYNEDGSPKDLFEVRYYRLNQNLTFDFSTAYKGWQNQEDMPHDHPCYLFWKKWDIFHLTTLTIDEWQEMHKDLQTIEKEIAKKTIRR